MTRFPELPMTPSTDDAGKSMSFEDALAELENIVHALEAGDVTLEGALAQYESGVGLLKRCYGLLRQAEQRILLLSGEDADGKPLVQSFDPAQSGKTERPEQLRRKRSDSSY